MELIAYLVVSFIVAILATTWIVLWRRMRAQERRLETRGHLIYIVGGRIIFPPARKP